MTIAGDLILVVMVVGIWAIMLLAVGTDLQWVVQHTIQSRRDTRLFKNIEEFRRDFRP